MVGNVLIVVSISTDLHLRTPMYFFLGNLSVLELCFTSVTLPNILVNCLRKIRTISYLGCVVQVTLLGFFVGTECFLLVLMACDRYVAICFPLRYAAIMSKKLCLNLAACTWTGCFFHSVFQTAFTFRFPFCGSREVDNLYCEIQPVLKLACGDTQVNQILLSTSASFFTVGALLFILISYVFIVLAVLKIPSVEGRSKAFSTCTSHLTVVILFYAALIFMYMRPTAGYSGKADSLVSVIYSVATPVLNPIIYSLRNKELKGALRKVVIRITG
ncbi:olfactory receptor 5V1-like [Ambystoma mexicanum]|uniref:olfactory receptor 5V1-like n=1 Tax=Ambystoma mexicanum TaxID=8296 RepID=UPI0037E91FC0